MCKRNKQASVFTTYAWLVIRPYKWTSAVQVPQFNAFMFLENKSQIGKVDEIFGTIKDGVSTSFLGQRNHCVASCHVASDTPHNTVCSISQ